MIILRQDRAGYKYIHTGISSVVGLPMIIFHGYQGVMKNTAFFKLGRIKEDRLSMDIEQLSFKTSIGSGPGSELSGFNFLSKKIRPG